MEGCFRGLFYRALDGRCRVAVTQRGCSSQLVRWPRTAITSLSTTRNTSYHSFILALMRCFKLSPLACCATWTALLRFTVYPPASVSHRGSCLLCFLRLCAVLFEMPMQVRFLQLTYRCCKTFQVAALPVPAGERKKRREAGKMECYKRSPNNFSTHSEFRCSCARNYADSAAV